MTGAASIQSSSAAPLSGVKAKQKQDNEKEGEAFGLNETSVFTDFFSFFESEHGTPETELVSKESNLDPQIDDQDKDEEATALQIEMTHLSWFGGEKGTQQLDESGEVKSPLFIVKGDPERPDFETGDMSAPMPPLAVSDWQQTAADSENSNLLYRLAPQEPPSGRWGAKIQDERPQPIHPLEIAESLAKADLTATALQKAAAQAESAANAKTPSQAADTGSAGSQKGSDAVAANVKASLSALEAMLMQQNSQEFDGSTGDESRSALIEKALKDARISSVRQETHYGFGLSQSPVLQIAQRITHEIQIGRYQSIDQSDLQTGVSKPPVRVLQIQLDPPHLGPLTIRMSLQNEVLDLQLETPKHETAHLLQNDKDSLSKLLRSAGYAVDGLNIQVSSAERGSNSPSSNLGGGFGQAAGQQPGWRQPERQATEGGWRGANQGNVAAPPQKDASAHQPGRPRGGAVYL